MISKNIKKCIVEECDNNAISKGYCGKHYLQIRNYGRLTPELERDRKVFLKLEKFNGRKCRVENCNNKHYAKGYCLNHYKQMIRYIKRHNFEINEKIELLNIESLINLIKKQIYLDEISDSENINKIYELTVILENKLIKENNN